MSEAIVIIIGFLLAAFICALPFLFVLLIIKMTVGKSGSKNKSLNGEEAKIIQEINRGLARMEERVESLETIMLDKTEKPK